MPATPSPAGQVAALRARPDDVGGHVKTGADIIVAMAAGEPGGLIETLGAHAAIRTTADHRDGLEKEARTLGLLRPTDPRPARLR